MLHTSEHFFASEMITAKHTPFPFPLFFDSGSIKCPKKPKTSMQYVLCNEKNDTSGRSLQYQYSRPLKLQQNDSHSTSKLPYQPCTIPEYHGIILPIPDKLLLSIPSPSSPSIHAPSAKQLSPRLPPLSPSSPLSSPVPLSPLSPSSSPKLNRITDSQFTVFLDYPQTKTDPSHNTSHTAHAESDFKSYNHSPNNSPKAAQPHTGLLMLLNCAQPTVASDPMRPTKRLNDYTGDFKKEFCAMLVTHHEARAAWDSFWRKHGCTGKRPCIKAYLAFCDLYQEFSDLRRNPRFKILGTRTACRCTRTIHAFQPPKSTRYAPY